VKFVAAYVALQFLSLYVILKLYQKYHYCFHRIRGQQKIEVVGSWFGSAEY
jgi:hypothetical protein